MTQTTLQLSRVSKRFEGVCAAEEISFQVMHGECKILIGPNGAGKTTLLRIISGLTREDSGEIRLTGKRIESLAANRRARNGIAYAFQIPRLIPTLTVLDNLCLAGRTIFGFDTWHNWMRYDERLVEHARSLLRRFHMSDLEHLEVTRVPHSVKKKLDVACAVIRQPKVLLLDEPTAGLQSEELDEMHEVLAGILGSTAALIIEHDLRFVQRLGGTILLLDQGKVLIEGDWNQVTESRIFDDVYIGRPKQ